MFPHGAPPTSRASDRRRRSFERGQRAWLKKNYSLDFRREGDTWACYLRLRDETCGTPSPRLLGAIHMSLVKRHEPLREGFIALMQQAVALVAGEAIPGIELSYEREY